jgi:hypothetical protein
MYRWKDHPWSKSPFQEKILSRMRELTNDKIDEYIADIRKALPDQGEEFLTEKRLHNLRMRACLLHSIGWSGNTTFTPLELGQAYTATKLEKLSLAMRDLVS